MPDGRIRPRHRPLPRFDHGRPIALLPSAPIVAVLMITAVLIFATWGRIEHVVLVDLPIPAATNDPRAAARPSIRVTVSRDDRIYWNGEPVTPVELVVRIEATKVETIQPYIIFSPEGGAGYGAVALTLSLIRQADMLDWFCFAGLDEYRTYEQPVAAPPAGMPQATCQPDPLLII